MKTTHSILHENYTLTITGSKNTTHKYVFIVQLDYIKHILLEVIELVCGKLYNQSFTSKILDCFTFIVSFIMKIKHCT